MHDFNAMIDAVCRHLESQGFTISDRGEGVPNVLALKGERRVSVKTTGQTNPEGAPFTDSQVRAHVARIVFDALKLNDTKAATDELWLAMPADAGHQKHGMAIAQSLRILGIGVLWVDEAGGISPFS